MVGEHCNLDTGKCFKEGEWILLSEVDNKLETGDLLELPSMFPRKYPIVGGIVVPIVNHYGIYLEVDGKPMVAHNPWGGHPEIISLEQFETDRKIKRIIRTGMTAEHIIEKTKECEGTPYQFFGRNCELFVSFVCGCAVGWDQRWGWALFLIMIVLLFFAFRKSS